MWGKQLEPFTVNPGTGTSQEVTEKAAEVTGLPFIISFEPHKKPLFFTNEETKV